MKEIEDDKNKYEDIPCLWIGRINVVKVTIFLKAIYSNPYQNNKSIFHRTGKK